MWDLENYVNEIIEPMLQRAAEGIINKSCIFDIAQSRIEACGASEEEKLAMMNYLNMRLS